MKVEIGTGSVVCMANDLLPVDDKNWYVPVWLNLISILQNERGLPPTIVKYKLLEDDISESEGNVCVHQLRRRGVCGADER